MPQLKPSKLYDLDHISPLIDAGFTLLTPNLRLSRRIKSVWDQARAAAGDSVWAPLQVLSLESWLQQRWQQAVAMELVAPQLLISTGQALELWQQVIAEQQTSSDSYHLLRPSAAAALANQARDSLLRWQVDTGQALTRQEFELDQDCSTYLCWQQLFEQRLATDQLTTAGDAATQLLACAAQLPKSRVVLLDFEDIPPLYRAALDALCEDVQQPAAGATNGRQLARAFPNKRAELAAAARWARQQSEQNPEALLGIILPDMATDKPTLEYFLRQEFACLGDRYQSLPVNFSAGVPLDRVPVIRDALQLLRMGLRTVDLVELVALLQSRFIICDSPDSALLHKLLGELFDNGQATVQIGELRYRASTIKLAQQQGLELGQQLLDLSNMRVLRQQTLPSNWVRPLTEVLDLWGWPGRGPLDSMEYQQVELWYELLEDFASYDSISGAISFEAALQLLASCCARQMFQPQTADSCVQVLGALEGAGLIFDQLWICGMQGGNWPAAARPNPFIPVQLQRQLQMPHATAEREWAFAEGLVQQYARSSQCLNASYSEQVDGVPELPSALLRDFEWLDSGPPADLRVDFQAQWQDRQLEALRDDCAPRAEPDELARVGGGSALLEDQSHCPFRAFAKRRLSARPLGEFSVGMSAAERGSLLHDALYSLWGEIGDSAGLAQLDSTETTAVIERAVADALGAIPARRFQAIGTGYRELEGRRLAALLDQWLVVERQRDEFVVAAREQAISLSLEQLQITLRVDRIDRLADGSQLIIDYKSGRSNVQEWLGERPEKPQLLLYGIASDEEVAALSFAQVRSRDCKYVGAGQVEAAPGIRTDIAKLAGDKMAVADWLGLNAAWRDNLERLAQEFVAGAAAVDPLKATSCTYCGLQALCRVGDNTAPLEASV